MQSIMHEQEFKDNELVWRQGEATVKCLVIGSGKFVFKSAEDMEPFTYGAFVGDTKRCVNNEVLETSLVCKAKGMVYFISREDLNEFLNNNPGVKLALMS